MRAKRKKQPDGTNHYEIAYGEQTYLCVPYNGTKKFQCEQLGLANMSIEQIKVEIRRHHGEQWPPPESTTAQAQPSVQKTWNALSAEAMLVLTLHRNPTIQLTSDIIQCLDNYGYLDELGLPDTARAKREFDSLFGGMF